MTPALDSAARAVAEALENQISVCSCFLGMQPSCDTCRASSAALRAYDAASALRQAERAYLEAVYALDDWRDGADEGAYDFHSTEHNLELAVSDALCALLAARAQAEVKPL